MHILCNKLLHYFDSTTYDSVTVWTRENEWFCRACVQSRRIRLFYRNFPAGIAGLWERMWLKFMLSHFFIFLFILCILFCSQVIFTWLTEYLFPFLLFTSFKHVRVYVRAFIRAKMCSTYFCVSRIIVIECHNKCSCNYICLQFAASNSYYFCVVWI